MLRFSIFLLLVAAASAAMASDAGRTDEDRRLRSYFDKEWQWRLEQYPELATQLGDNRYNGRLTDLTAAAIEARNQHEKDALHALEAFSKDRLSTESRLDYELYHRELSLDIEGQKFPTEDLQIGPMSGVQIELPDLVSQTPFRTAKDYEMYLSRLSAIPTQVDQVIALLKKGVDSGWTPAAIVLAKVPAQIQAHASGPVEKSVFFEPFNKFPESVSKEDAERFLREGRRLVSESVQPAYARLEEYVRARYIPACRKDVGASALPDGANFYSFVVRYHTTTDLAPKEIHEIGLKEVARIRGEMEKVIAETGFKGSFEDFLTYLRTDPKFYYTNADDLVLGYRNICKRIDGELPLLFGRLPRNPYGVKVIPAAEAPAQTTAYYQPGAADGTRAGYYMVNTYKLDTRPTYEMDALTLHESVPGHHLQISIAQELTDLPDFRRNEGFTAFVEGWALYAESLGKDLGLYQNPYSRFGQLTYEMWRACRLVVDTGLHAFHWERLRAVDFMKANTAKTENDINVEVDRYIAWPGQALAYKIGQLKIRELRSRAEAALGARFDVRKFHDAVLDQGALPLEILEKNVDRWIEEQKR
jgi:uncharacterized protein (DUF885 family)